MSLSFGIQLLKCNKILTRYDLGGPYDYESVKKASKKFCKLTMDKLLDNYKKNAYPHVSHQSRLAVNCFKSAYLLNIIHEGFGIPKTINGPEDKPYIESIDKIDGFSVSWTMGVMFLYSSATIQPQSTLYFSATIIVLSSLLVVFSLLWYLIMIIYSINNYFEIVFDSITFYFS